MPADGSISAYSTRRRLRQVPSLGQCVTGYATCSTRERGFSETAIGKAAAQRMPIHYVCRWSAYPPILSVIADIGTQPGSAKRRPEQVQQNSPRKVATQSRRRHSREALAARSDQVFWPSEG